MKKIVFVAFVCIVCVAGAVFYYLFEGEKTFVPPKGTVFLRISKETTIVTEPLLPNGSAVDFSAVLDQFSTAGADSEDNGFRSIIRLLGRTLYGDISDEKWQILCAKLNLNPDDPPLLPYVPLTDFLYDALEKAEGKTPQFQADGKRRFDDAIQHQARQIAVSFSFRMQNEIFAEDLTLLERWITEMEPAISAVAEALKQPVYVVPPTGNYDFSEQFALPEAAVMPDFYNAMRIHNELTQMFSSHCLFRQIKSKTEPNMAGCWDDVLSLFRIARHFGRQAFPDATNFANAYERNAGHRAMEIMKTSKFEADKFRQCLADLDSLPERTKYEDRLEYIRFGWLKNISEFPQKGPIVFHYHIIEPIPDYLTLEEKQTLQYANAETKKTIHIYRTVPFDWNIVAEIMNAEFDDRQGKPTKQTIFQSQSELRKIYENTIVLEYSLEELNSIIGGGSLSALLTDTDDHWNIVHLQRLSIEERSVHLGKAFSKYALKPEWLAFLVREGTTAFEMLRTTIALRLYKVENGGYPKTLGGLIEYGYLPVVPNDPYRRGAPVPLSYRDEPEGSCILYSVGLNGIEDAGLYSTAFSLRDTLWDDIIVELD